MYQKDKAIALKLRYFLYKVLKKFIKQKAAVRYYLKGFLYVIDSIQYSEPIRDNSENLPVWTMWLQEDIPDICKVCINSIKKFYPNAIVITEENVDSYIEIPDYIKEKYQKGMMRACFYSDYIRVCLLEKYGGVWIDGTCFLTQKIPDYITAADFFVLHYYNKKDFSNFFIRSQKGHYILKVMKKYLETYWLYNHKAIYYFFFHEFLLLARKNNKLISELWKEIPYGSSENVFSMLSVAYKKYDEKMYKWLCQTSYIHKLTYKYVDTRHVLEDDLYNYLIKSNL